MVLILSGEVVKYLTRNCLGTSELLANQARFFQLLSSPSKANLDAPHRTTLLLKDATTLFMPARPGDQVTCKVVSVPRESNGLVASTVVLDGNIGSLKALVNTTSLTALRTAAGSALATLAIHGKSSDSAKHITVFGSGQQALHHASLFSPLFKVARLDFISRSSFPKSTLEELSLMGVRSEIVHPILSQDRAKVEESVTRADIIVCCTPYQTPLFSSKWVRPGAHIVFVGSYKPTMQEVEVELVHRARGRIIVDDVEACSVEAGDLIKAGVNSKECIPLGSLLNNKALAELSRGHIDTLPSAKTITTLLDRFNKDAKGGEIGDLTMFKSVRIGLQDVAITSMVVSKALEKGKGTQVDF